MREKGKVAPAQLKMFWMTVLMAVTTLIAGWHIIDIWSGAVTLLCALVTIWLVDEGVKVYGAVDSGTERQRKDV